MKAGSKIFTVGIILVLVLGVGIYYQLSGGNLFKGQILQGGTVDPALAAQEAAAGKLADLKASLVIAPADAGSTDLNVKATIENAGTGSILGNKPFTYAIYINGKEVFTNTDSYTTMDPGDAFSFNYPISKAIYQYPDKGEVKFVIDTTNALKEINKTNNTVTISYDMKNLPTN